MAEIKRFKKRSELEVDLKKLEKDLLSKIDPSDNVMRNKVSKYIKLEKMIRSFFEDVEERGLILETKNGSQEFAKHHPLIDKIRPFINTQLAIEESLGLHKANKAEEEPKKPTASDLI